MQVVPNTRRAIDDFLKETAEQENRETDGCGTTPEGLRRAIRWWGYPITDDYGEARRKVAADLPYNLFTACLYWTDGLPAPLRESRERMEESRRMLTRQVAEWDPCAGSRRTMTCRHCGARIDLRSGWGEVLEGDRLFRRCPRPSCRQPLIGARRVKCLEALYGRYRHDYVTDFELKESYSAEHPDRMAWLIGYSYHC